jgi:hypothetical protein
MPGFGNTCRRPTLAVSRCTPGASRTRRRPRCCPYVAASNPLRLHDSLSRTLCPNPSHCSGGHVPPLPLHRLLHPPRPCRRNPPINHRCPTARACPSTLQSRTPRARSGLLSAGLHLDGAPGSKRSSFKLLQWSAVLGRGPFKERCYIIASWLSKGGESDALWPALLEDLNALRHRAPGPVGPPPSATLRSGAGVRVRWDPLPVGGQGAAVDWAGDGPGSRFRLSARMIGAPSMSVPARLPEVGWRAVVVAVKGDMECLDRDLRLCSIHSNDALSAMRCHYASSTFPHGALLTHMLGKPSHSWVQLGVRAMRNRSAILANAARRH